jgi:hypothetical protein
MNIAYQAERLERFLEEEFTKKLPILVLPDKSIIYKQFKIKENKHKIWDLRWAKTGDKLDSFYTKTSALLAAKFYLTSNHTRYNEVKHLDLTYWNNSVDASFFKYRLNTARDFNQKDLFFCRYDLAKERSKVAQGKITQMFKYNF